VSLTLGILKSLYPEADLDTAYEGFAVTCSDDEELKLVKDSGKTASQIVDMLGIDMSFGWVSSFKYFVLLCVIILSQMDDFH
jgi:hypothetical protein